MLAVDADEVSEPRIIPMQPMPLDWWTARLWIPIVGWTTAVFRFWREGDSGSGGRCRLCVKCRARKRGCLILVRRNVGEESAPLLATNGLKFVRVVGREDVASRVVETPAMSG